MKFPWSKGKIPKVNLVKEAQEEIVGTLVSHMLIDFKTKFTGVYDDRTMVNMFTAVGPMQAFLGHCIKEGLISVGKNKVD